QIIDAIGEALAVQRVQFRQLCRIGGHDQLAATLVRDVVRGTEFVEGVAAGDAQLCLLRAAGVIKPGVDDLAVAGAGFGAEGIVLLEDDRLDAAPCQRAGAGQADDAGTDDHCFNVFHRGGIVKYAPFLCLNKPPVSQLLLAPMEGLADDVLRAVLTRVGGYDHAVTEFVRISGTLLPNRAFMRISPEVRNGGRTEAGTPVVVQLLGSDPACMAENAARLATLSPPGIDLNFGCPAPCVNRHRGGAALLGEPELLNMIVRAVRTAVPAGIPVTAKMRLGIADTSLAIDCATALAEGGAESLAVHARTKEQGYKPPAHWQWIAAIREAVNVPVVANGEVWSVADWQRCREVSGCDDVMLGRGAVSDPFLALRIRGQAEPQPTPADWQVLLPFLADFWLGVLAKVEPRHAPGRMKLLLGYLRRSWPEAEKLHAQVRPLRLPAEITDVFRGLLPTLPTMSTIRAAA
ncbi:MAG: tRNA-dihydrouridine synthase, partial [Pseudomonadota bacterium]|nr:tRNA-dihydrouridine synthase [Pseudomonadota bacterium]